jgi:DNA (cytosine-5)-methyltransferase 1
LARLTSVEVCAGAGGQALGLQLAGFKHLACVEVDKHACATLRHNRRDWPILEEDLRGWCPPKAMAGVSLLTGGVPCPPFSRAGKQLGRDDDRDLFPEMIRLIQVLTPEAVMIENVRGLLGATFGSYRRELLSVFEGLGYTACGDGPTGWQLLNAADFGIPQARRRAILVLLRPAAAEQFEWPTDEIAVPTVGELLRPLMAEGGWEKSDDWAAKAQGISPALVGGSKKHGGADLGPTRAKTAWRRLGVDGNGLADAPPKPGFDGLPRLTVPMAAALQGFPADWHFSGGKTAAYRQIGNAFPPPVAQAVGESIARAILKARRVAAASRRSRAARVGRTKSTDMRRALS